VYEAMKMADLLDCRGKRNEMEFFGGVTGNTVRLARPHRLLAREDPLDLGGRRKGIAFVPQAMG
jgi:hypothetical protein